ncbi:MAG: ATP-binding cassette domain-containing protein, partial [Desulfurococcaceae archaeon]
MEYVIKLIDVWKIYKMGSTDFPALRGVDLEVERKDVIAIMGPSGSGKSTLLNIMGLLDRPTRGTVLIDNVDVSKLPEHVIADFRNRKIGFVFQHF